jgi:hypothetical protein
MILNMFHIALIMMHAVVDKHLAMQIGSVRPSAPGRSGSGQLNSHKAARPDGSDPLPAAASIRSVHLLVGQLYVRPAFSGKGTRGKAEGSRAEEREADRAASPFAGSGILNKEQLAKPALLRATDTSGCR